MTKTLSDQVSINKFDNKHSILLLLAFFNTSVVLAATSDLLTFSTQPVVFDERKCTVFVDAATGSNSNNGSLQERISQIY